MHERWYIKGAIEQKNAIALKNIFRLAPILYAQNKAHQQNIELKIVLANTGKLKCQNVWPNTPHIAS